MKIEDVVPTPHAEAWVEAAFARRSEAGQGTFALVLNAEDGDYVVKLTRSEADYAALLHFSGTNPHFPIVIKYAVDQGQGYASRFHAVLMEKLPKISPLEASAIADHIHMQETGKHNPKGLIQAADDLRNGKVKDAYPDSLADALQALGEYAVGKWLRVELNQRVNWGQRADGTLVIFDLVHSRLELM
jgi:hypothetical protein